ncbi:MAG: histone deacetylase family protein [Pseudomonadota bacterium]
MTTALVTHTDCLLHRTPAHVPEQVARLDVVLRALEDLPMTIEAAPPIDLEALHALHDPAYVARVLSGPPDSGFACLDADREGETCLSSTSLNAVLRAAGGAVRAVDLVLGERYGNAFVAVRPPGHHALADKSMGFCFFGNVALAARHALEAHGLSRVTIVDFDVHHGNGTQALMWDEPRVLVVTSQQMPLWPGTGSPSDTGAHGNVLNVPLPPGSGGPEMRMAYAETVFPRLRSFAPELILISAGFDAHRDDPLAELNWREEDFNWLTRSLCAIARECGRGRVVSVLEGGYDLHALGLSARAHARGLCAAFD